MRYARKRWRRLLAVLALPIVAFDCGAEKPMSVGSTATPAGGGMMGKIRPATTKVTPNPEVVRQNKAADSRSAQAERAKVRPKTFEEFEASVYKEAGPNGKYIVNGDTPIADRKHLREFYDQNVHVEPPGQAELAVNVVNGQDGIWNSTKRKNLTYCVSNAFGGRQGQVITAMQTATAAWTQVGDVAFVHVAPQDANCTASNANVVFDVNPVNVNGEYLARAFFPNEPRAARNVLIDESAFHLPAGEKLQLQGILRHELGHTLGFRHEHTRPESGTCFEDADWRPLTDYDAFSVMHYPQCNGGGDWSLKLTDCDNKGIWAAVNTARTPSR